MAADSQNHFGRIEGRMHGKTIDRTTLLDRARSIAPLIEREADKVEQETRITPAIHDALTKTELYWIALPAAFGGAEADITSCFEVVEEIARADGSTGWTYFVNLATLSGLFPFMPDEMVSAVFADGERPVLAGQLFPVGRSEELAEGYRCSGQHNFASGSAFANWICASQFVFDGDERVINDDGTPRITISLLPSDRVVFKGNWNVMGLAGTASYDYEVPEQEVPSSQIMDGGILSPDAKALRGHPMLQMGSLAHAYCLHTACTIGIAKRAMQELVALVSKKTRMGYGGTVVQDEVFLNEFAQADAEFRSARGRVLAVFSEAEAKVAAGSKLTPRDHAVMRQTATWAHGKAGEVASFCFRWAGTTPVRNPSVLGRCMRDVLVANSHLLFDAKSLTDAGPALVARWMDEE